MEKKTRKNFNCCRCYQTFSSGKAKPKYCGKCKSSLWNVGRTYEVLGGDEPTKKRTAATGKAAKNARPETIRAERIAELEKQIDWIDLEYRENRDRLASPDFSKFLIQNIFYCLEQYRATFRALRLELADLVETDPRENFYFKRGTFYTLKDRIAFELETIEKHFHREAGTEGRFARDLPETNERERQYTTAIAGRRVELQNAQDDIDELNRNQPPVEAPDKSKHDVVLWSRIVELNDRIFRITSDGLDSQPLRDQLFELEKQLGKIEVFFTWRHHFGYYLNWNSPIGLKTLAFKLPDMPSVRKYAKDRGWTLIKNPDTPLPNN